MTLGKIKCREGLNVCTNYEFNVLHHVGVVAKRVCAAETAHEGDDNTPSGRVVKNQVSGNSHSTKPMEEVSKIFRFGKSWLLYGPGKLPTPRAANCHYLQETLTFPVFELTERVGFESRKYAYLTGMRLMFSCRKQSHLFFSHYSKSNEKNNICNSWFITIEWCSSQLQTLSLYYIENIVCCE